MNSTIPFRSKAEPGFFVAVAVLLVAVLLSYYSLTRLVSNARLVDHTNVVILKLESALSSLKDAETGLRGYLLTGKDRFLESYSQSSPRLALTVQELSSLTSDNQSQQKRLDTLNKLIKRHFATFQREINSYQQQNRYDTASIEQGKATMDEIRRLVRRMELEEQRLLAGRANQLDQYAAYTPVLLVISALVALVLVILSYLRLQNNMRQLQAAKGEIEAKNKLIEGIVRHFPITLSKINQQGYFQLVDGSARQQLNLPAEALAGKNAFDVFPQAVPSIRRALAGEAVSFEGSVPVNGQNAYFQHYYYYDPAGNGVMGVSIDTTERKKAEQELHEKNKELAVALEELKSTEEQLVEVNNDLERRVEERTVRLEEQRAALHNLFMQVPALIGILRGREGRVELFNATFSQLWGNREVMGKTMREAWPELEGQGYFEFVESVYDSGRTVSHKEYPGSIDRQNNGRLEPAYFDFVYAPYYDLTGKVDGVIIYGVDVTAQVLSRKKVEESEEQLRFAIEAAELATWDFNPITNQFTADARYEEWFGLAAKEATDNNLALQVIAEEDRERVIAAYTQALVYGSGNKYDIEYTIRPGAKPERVLRAKGKAWFGEDKVAYRFNGTLQDVTEQVRAREKMEQSEAKFRHLIESNIIGVLYWDLDGGIVDANEAFLSRFGYTRQELEAGLDWRRMTPPQWREQDKEGERQVLQTGHHLPFEKQYLHKDGTPVDVIIGSSAFGGAGNRQGVTFVLDITERKQTEKALRESEERFRAMADNISQLAWIADGTGWIFWYNQRWYHYTGTNLEEMQGWGWEKVHHPDHIDRVVAFVKEAWKKGEAWELEFPLRRYDGQYRWFLTRAVPILDAEGRIVGWFGTNTDITEQQLARQQLQVLNQELAATGEELAAANEELRAANEEVQASNEELSDTNRQLVGINRDLDNFIYTASHDLKAPITNIEGLMRALERSVGPENLQKETTRKVIRLIYDSVDRFKRTITDLMEVAKVQKGEQDPVAEVNLREMIEEVKLDLDGPITETDAQVTNDVATDLFIRFSRKNLKSVIYNLLSNAIKYRSPERPPLIRLRAEKRDGYVVFTVADNGLGMNLKAGGQIFQMFKRLHTHVEGSGIGLYIVKKMIDDSGGRIEVESGEGQGSVFTVFFKA